VIHDLTINEQVLLAAYQLDQQGRARGAPSAFVAPFSAEELIVASWRSDHDRLGLRGYSTIYPNAHKIMATMSMSHSPIAKGWMVRTQPGFFAITAAGRARARFLLGLDKTPPPEEPGDTFEDLEATTAMQLHREGKSESIRFPDVCRLWGFTEGAEYAEAMAKIEAVGKRLLEAQDEPQGRYLWNAHRMLLGRFEKHLKLLRGGEQINGTRGRKKAYAATED
jgi:hypothetical protein